VRYNNPISEQPVVSIIIPMRNERRYIRSCLNSIVSSTYPRESIEVIVVDGMSEDRSADEAREFLSKFKSFHLLVNPCRTTPHALNMGLKVATGEIIIRMDSHSTYPPDYIRRCVNSLLMHNCDNVGGVLDVRPGDRTVLAEAISVALSHPFGVGNAYFRIGTVQPRWVDTVPFGCFRRELFDLIGKFDVDLVRNQDDEFNFRIVRNGGRVLLDPTIRCQYFSRSTLRQVRQMYFQYGYFKPLVMKKVGGIMTLRQLVPSLFVGGLIFLGFLSVIWPTFFLLLFSVLFCYIALATIIGCRAGLTYGIGVGLNVPVVFAFMHIPYGVGTIIGFFVFFVLGKSKRVVSVSR